MIPGMFCFSIPCVVVPARGNPPPLPLDFREEAFPCCHYGDSSHQARGGLGIQLDSTLLILLSCMLEVNYFAKSTFEDPG